MTRYYNLIQTVGADMETRFTIDGKRVSREYYNYIRDGANRLECMITRSRQMDGGKIRRKYYSVAVWG